MHHSNPLTGTTQLPRLRVSRPIAACSRCRRIKIKCDGKLPACSACEKAGYANSCASPKDNSCDGSEKSYVAYLESLVAELNEKIAFAESRKESVTSQDIPDSVKVLKHSDSFAAIRDAAQVKAARIRETADINELVSDFGFLSVSANTQDFEKSTTSMTFGRLILAATCIEPLPEPQPLKLPSKTDTMSLVIYYINEVLHFNPIFSQRLLLDVVDSFYQENPHPVTDFEYWLFCMVLAISSSSQSRSSGDEFFHEGLIWVGRALRLADRVLVPGYVTQIQALVLLVQYSMLDPAHFDSWNLVGFACRALIDLGFHYDPPKEEQIDKRTLELRRSIFYCVYSLDRSISMVHARPFSFTDDSTNVSLPALRAKISSESSGRASTNQKSLHDPLYLFRFRIIQSSWYQELFQSNRDLLELSTSHIWEICRGMREWAESLPRNLSTFSKILFDLELSYSYVYCLAPSNRIKTLSPYAKSQIYESSINYIRSIATICKNSSNHFFYTFHDALRLFFVGSQFTSVLKENQDQLLNSATSFIPPFDGCPRLLLIPSIDTQDKIEKSLECICKVKDTLKILSYRWDDCKVLLSSFEAQVENLVEGLEHRKYALNESSRI